MFNTRHLLHRTPFYTKQLLHQTLFRPDTTSHTYPLAHNSKKKYKSRVPFFLKKLGTLLFTGLVVLGPSAGKLYPPTSLPLRGLLPCYFCISSPTVPPRNLRPRSPSVASSQAISASPASAYPLTSLPLRSLLPCYFCISSLSVHSNLAPPP